MVLHRTLLFLQATIKSLSSNRIMKGRLLMQSAGNILFPTLRDIYQHLLQIAVGKLETEGIGPVDEVDELEIALLSFKCLSKLTVYGCGDASEDPTARVRSLLPKRGLKHLDLRCIHRRPSFWDQHPLSLPS